MGFLSKTDVNSIELEEHRRKMDAWAEKYPLAAVIMSNISYERKIQYTEERFCKS